jgi:hypothetical protein
LNAFTVAKVGATNDFQKTEMSHSNNAFQLVVNSKLIFPSSQTFSHLTCGVNVDWANNEEIADADNDNDKEGGDDALKDNDLDLDMGKKKRMKKRMMHMTFLSQSKYLCLHY